MDEWDTVLIIANGDVRIQPPGQPDDRILVSPRRNDFKYWSPGATTISQEGIQVPFSSEGFPEEELEDLLEGGQDIYTTLHDGVNTEDEET